MLPLALPAFVRRAAARVVVAALPLLATAVGAADPAKAAFADSLDRYVFVPSRHATDIAIIDTATNTVTVRLPVGRMPQLIAVSSSAMKLLASDTSDPTLSIFDLRTLEKSGDVTLANPLDHLALAPAGDIAAVAGLDSGTVSLVSLADHRKLARIDGLDWPHTMIFSRDGRWLYVGNLGANRVSVIDVDAGRLAAEIALDNDLATPAGEGADWQQGIASVARTPDGRLGFATYGYDATMAVIDLASNEVVETLRLGQLPWRAFPTADSRYVIVPNIGDHTVSVVSTETMTEVVRLQGAADMTGVLTGWFETTAFVISRGDEKLVVLDLLTMSNAGDIAMPGIPETGVATADGKWLYVAMSGTDEIAVVDTRQRRVVERIGDVGVEPWGAQLTGSLNYCD